MTRRGLVGPPLEGNGTHTTEEHRYTGRALCLTCPWAYTGPRIVDHVNGHLHSHQHRVALETLFYTFTVTRPIQEATHA